MTVAPLSSRPLDALYVAFFIIHIPCTLLVDLQALYPQWLIPGWMQDLASWYFSTYGDPVLSGGMGLHSRPVDVVWLRSFFYLEGFFQFPVFFIGAWALYYGRHTWYPLLIAYAASTATTLVPCMAYLWTYPIASAKVSNFATMTVSQQWQVIGMMTPWVIIPTLMAVDLSLRVARVLAAADHVSATKKVQ